MVVIRARQRRKRKSSATGKNLSEFVLVVKALGELVFLLAANLG